MKKIALMLALGVLAGCAAKPLPPVIRDLPVPVEVPVAQPCVAGVRPAKPVPLNQQYTPAQWAALDTKQKAAIVSKQALAQQTYAENINGATVGCQ